MNQRVGAERRPMTGPAKSGSHTLRQMPLRISFHSCGLQKSILPLYCALARSIRLSASTGPGVQSWPGSSVIFMSCTSPSRSDGSK